MEVPFGYCECGCGNLTSIAKQTITARGQVEGMPVRFLRGHSTRRNQIYVVEDRGYKSPCWIYTGFLDKRGYGMIQREGRAQRAHRWAYIQKFGPIPDGLEPDHLCRVRPCINPDHLEPIAHVENVRRGASTKLTPESVREIRLLRSRGIKYVELARQFGVTDGMIGSILMRRSWKDVD